MTARSGGSTVLAVAFLSGFSIARVAVAQSGDDRGRVGAKSPATGKSPWRRPNPTNANVSYGPHSRNVLDFWKARAGAPTPLIVFAHGGGFVGGDKRTFPTVVLKQSLAAGISFATINYRFVGNGVTFPDPQHDGARAIQFLRSKASEWNIDPHKIAAFGNSAGGGIVLWLGFHDDLANPAALDPVERQSSRVVALGSIGGQSTYNPIQIKEMIGGRAWEHPSMFKVFGISSAKEALHPNPALQRLYKEASALSHLTKDDPPVFMIFAEPEGPLPANARPGQGIHHPKFAHVLEAGLKELGIESRYRHASDGKPGDPHVEMVEFFQQQFARAKQVQGVSPGEF